MKPSKIVKPEIPSDYCGIILGGDYSDALKDMVADYIRRYRGFEETGCPALLYIAAWREDENDIWYEYASDRFVRLLKCRRCDLSTVFRKSVIDRRIYKYTDASSRVESAVESHCSRSLSANSLILRSVASS